MRATPAPPTKQDGVSHVDQDQDCRSRPCHRCRDRRAGFLFHAGPAKPFWVGPAIVGAAVIGTAVAVSAANDGYYYGYRRCGFTPRYNVYGQYMGSVRVCNY